MRQHLDTKRKGHREALKEHEAHGAGDKGGGSGGASSEKNVGSIIAYMGGIKPFTSEKDVGSIIAYMGGIKPFTSEMVRFLMDSSNNRLFRTFLRSLAVVMDARFSRKVGRDSNKRIASHGRIQDLLLWGYFLRRYLGDEFSHFLLVSPPGSIVNSSNCWHVPLVRGRFTWYTRCTFRFLCTSCAN